MRAVGNRSSDDVCKCQRHVAGDSEVEAVRSLVLLVSRYSVQSRYPGSPQARLKWGLPSQCESS